MMKTRGAAMVEYAVLLLATSLVAIFFFRFVGQRAGFNAARADSALSAPRAGRSETREASGIIERGETNGRRRRAGVSQ